ncbi:MAG: ABC transporter permease [Christensenellaceae bacterium]|jgi:putative ABC transport system permease protein|nr:ABC transporter permease [Christensenellaceae bacterium]
MRRLSLLSQALTSLKLNKIRSFLTILGLAVGVGAIVAIGSLGFAGMNEVSAELKRFGVDRLWLEADSPDMELGEEQLHLLSKKAPELLFCPMRYAAMPASAGRESRIVQIVGTLSSYLEIESLPIARGRFLLQQDQESSLRVAVIDEKLARDLKIGEPVIGQKLRLSSGSFVIVGLIQSAGATFLSDGSSEPPKVYLPLSSFEQYIGLGAADEVSIRVPGGIDEGIATLRRALVESFPDQQFTISSLRAQIESAGRVMDIFKLVLLCVGAICMLTGGIGVMNVLLCAVRERKREIGIRKALGARDSDIAEQFVFEALLYGLAGAAAGMLLGAVFTRLGANVVEIRAPISASMTLLAVGFSCLVGLVSGVYPALRASKIPPVAAMRSGS